MNDADRIDLTPENLAHMRELAEAATSAGSYGSGPLGLGEYARILAAHPSRDIWQAWRPQPVDDRGHDGLTVAITGNGPTSEANARFFASAKQMVLTLLEERGRLLEETRAQRRALAAAAAFAQCPDLGACEHYDAMVSALDDVSALTGEGSTT